MSGKEHGREVAGDRMEGRGRTANKRAETTNERNWIRQIVVATNTWKA